MQRVAPAHTSCWELKHLLRDEEPRSRAVAATDRLLQLASGLEPGAHLSLVLAGDGTGRVTAQLHTDTSADDIDALIGWVAAGTGEWVPLTSGDAHLTDPEGLRVLTEVLPAVRAPLPPESLLLRRPDSQEPPAPGEAPSPDLWPVGLIDDGMELLQALTTLRAQIRVHLAPASLVETQMITEQTRRSVQSRDPVHYSQYMGAPVRIRTFVGQSGALLSPRLRAALGRLGIGLRLVPRDIADPEIRAAWDGDELTLAGAVQPFGVAQCLVRLPACGEQAVLCGVATADAETPPVPLEADADGVRGLRLGSAIAGDGHRHEVRVAPEELLLHTQVLGATGTGKSTLLAALVQEAVAAGMGVTVIESHGPLVERIVAELPDTAVDRTIVIRSGDLAAPVPLNPLRCGDPEMISEVMLQVMRELLDPGNQGFLGPRFERIFGQTLEAQRVLVGERATLSALPHLLRNPAQVRDLAAALKQAHPVLADQILSEFGNLTPDDFGELVGWINAKYNRLVASPELRAILATGEDAVDVTRVIDDRQILLVDLAAPTVGPLGAQFLGEIWLAKHWAALARRRDPAQPHLLIVDEAHLFASGLLPRLLAEARKFGVGVVLAHQHLEQLTPHLRDATLATTSNIVVFRSGPREAAAALTRLGGWSGGPLTRLPRFHAAATLSLGHQQPDAFSLFVDHNARTESAPRPEHIAWAIEEGSRRRYAEPYRDAPAVTVAVIDDLVRQRRLSPGVRTPQRPPQPAASGSSFLDEWLAARRAQEPAPTPEEPDDGSDDQDGGTWR